jgi:hypothetical protein
MQPPRRVSDAIVGAPESIDELEHDLRTLVTISRTHQRDVGLRHVFVRLDDGPQIAIRFGQSLTETVDPGTHRLRVHNTLMRKTVNFAVEPGEHLEFILINYCGPIWQGIAGLLGAAPIFLKVHRRSIV